MAPSQGWPLTTPDGWLIRRLFWEQATMERWTLCAARKRFAIWQIKIPFWEI
jgi:hypothetical protein